MIIACFQRYEKKRITYLKKKTAIAIAIALKLNEAETNELLSAAGFTLSRSSKFDIIIEFFIQQEMYDVHKN